MLTERNARPRIWNAGGKSLRSVFIIKGSKSNFLQFGFYYPASICEISPEYNLVKFYFLINAKYCGSNLSAKNHYIDYSIHLVCFATNGDDFFCILHNFFSKILCFFRLAPLNLLKSVALPSISPDAVYGSCFWNRLP
jgi:hypothetical protein